MLGNGNEQKKQGGLDLRLTPPRPGLIEGEKSQVPSEVSVHLIQLNFLCTELNFVVFGAWRGAQGRREDGR